MSRPNRSLTTRPNPRPHKCPTFTPSEINHLLESSVVFVRSHALYAMALGAGLGATHLNALDLVDVTPDGKYVTSLVVPHRLASRRRKTPSFTLTTSVRQVLARYLAWRRARCAHFKTRLQTYTDGDGIERCHACDDVADPLQAPLFVGLRGTRLSSKQMRDEFGRWRHELGLNPKLRFDSMRASFRDSVLLRDGSQLGALIRDDES
jgi:site-specific recombinase XerC